ncbi:ABC transporter substrate-binding protein [Pseudonocardia sp. N23]|uniref:ABC transporter substrate-binding protein n=1 Tax=Pseudonocardia sp. N23 TaxID=1987376 RepID=UPI000BFBE5E1|nr:ABC transporter substrate-binding protein [Pseudonocardia sp. N23]GAY07605.1 oligopeptide ABC transporter, periplasmic oligopeptide-binding protein OppA [Pseudonocardia sp. N23]
MTVRFRRPLIASVLAAAAFAVVGCGTGAGPTGATAAGGAPQPGGTLRFAVSSDQGCVDPQQVASTDSIYFARQIVDSLTDQDPRSGALVPWLATTWQSSPDAKSYTFTLRENVTFADGTPLDAEAVKANFDRIPQLGLRAQLPKAYLAGYAGTTVQSPTRFTVSFAEPNVQFLQGTSTHSLGILSPATVARSEDDRCTAVVGSGPFAVRDYVRNSSITLAKRPGYAWASPLSNHQGEAYLDTLDFRIVPESGVRTGSLVSGEVDAIGTIGEQDEAPLTDAGAQLLARPNPGLVLGLGLNLSTPVVADPTVREALSLAIDRQEIVDAIYPSQTRPATSVLASTTPSFADESALLGFDTGRAKSLLDAAGWVPGPDGIRAKDGARLAVPVSFVSNFSTNKPALELVQQQARVVGIDVQLLEVPISTVAAQLQSGDFVANWANLTRADPDILRSSFSTAGVNTYRFPRGPLDASLTAQASEPDPVKRTAIVRQAQEIMVREKYYVPVVELTTVLGVGANVHDVTFDAASRVQLHGAWKSQ